MLRGPELGEFDQIAWITMKKDGPLLANILIEDVLSENLQRPVTNEPVARKKDMHAVKGRVFFEGGPIPGAQIALHNIKNPNFKKATGTVLFDGTFQISTNTALDGALAGDYIVTVFHKKGEGQPRPLPSRYADPATSDLRVTIRPGDNEVVLELKN